MNPPILHPLPPGAQNITPPDELNNPFCYKPHPLCLAAVDDVMPLIKSLPLPEDEGKMFGVLIVESKQPLSTTQDLYYLAAYSGQIGGRADWSGFVPAIVDYLQPDGYFKTHEADISELNKQIERQEQNPERIAALDQLNNLRHEAQDNIEAFRQKVIEGRIQRKKKRETQTLSDEQEAELVKESQFQKAELRRMRKRYKTELEALSDKVDIFEKPIQEMKRERRNRSDALQHWLFQRFDLLNLHGERRTLTDIFAQTSMRVPPSGAGECCAPRLLQYAFEHQLKPLAIAEFWHGPSPKVEIRHNGHFYPACRGKCLPILTWMLDIQHPSKATGRRVSGNPITYHPSHELPIIYEDDDIIVVDKPAGLLSTLGISENYSVLSIMQQRYPDTDSPLIVHRLDQPTSGLLVIAKTKQAHYLLQQQFLEHQVKKKYVAILEKEPSLPQTSRLEGFISLPMRPDILNRPYQIIDYENGKTAITKYQYLGNRRIALWPQTGRTHQLRVHCAHAEGLNAPILGDDLYGSQSADRLFLHAEEIFFIHPTTGKPLHLQAKAPF